MNEWRKIDESTPHGEYLLYFPATKSSSGRNALRPRMIVDLYPVSYPRKPTYYMPLPEPPEDDR